MSELARHAPSLAPFISMVAARRQSQVRLIPLLLIIVAGAVGLACAIVLIGGRH